MIGADFNPKNDTLPISFQDCLGMNRFYIGCLFNRDQAGETPTFVIAFTFEAGFSVNDIKNLAWRLEKDRVPVSLQNRWNEHVESLNGGGDMKRCYGIPYRFIPLWGMSKPTYLFPKPIVVSLKSSSFDYQSTGFNNTNYRWVPRHPRLKAERSHEVSMLDCITYQELQSLGTHCKTPNENFLENMEDELIKLDAYYLQKKKPMLENGDSVKVHSTFSLPDPIDESQAFMQLPLIQEKQVNLKLIRQPEAFEGDGRRSSSSSSRKVSSLSNQYSNSSADERPQIFISDCFCLCWKRSVLLPQVLSSTAALYLGTGWDCLNEPTFEKHRPGIIFCFEEECDSVLEALEGVEWDQRSVCPPHLISVVNATFLKQTGDLVDHRFIYGSYFPRGYL